MRRYRALGFATVALIGVAAQGCEVLTGTDRGPLQGWSSALGTQVEVQIGAPLPVPVDYLYPDDREGPVKGPAAPSRLRASSGDFFWSSSDPSVATVSDEGVVTGVAPGGPIAIHIEGARVGIFGKPAATVQVYVLPTRTDSAFITVAPGWENLCALAAGGRAYCWGGGTLAQLGSSWARSHSLLIPAAGTLRFTAIIASPRVCGLTTDGAIYCWPPIDHDPVRVSGDLVFRSIAHGPGGLCALTEDGQPYCWDGDTPVPVSGALRFASLTGGDMDYYGAAHACGLTADGTAYCWGTNWHGQAGVDSLVHSPGVVGQPLPSLLAPVPVQGGLHFTALAAFGAGTCGITPEGTAYCWGLVRYGNSDGLAGRPQPRTGAPPFVAISAGMEHVCALTAAGQAYCWGNNHFGQLGDGTTTNRWDPAPVVGGMIFSSLHAGSGSTCGITPTGALYCWGVRGSLANNLRAENSPVPLAIR